MSREIVTVKLSNSEEKPRSDKKTIVLRSDPFSTEQKKSKPVIELPQRSKKTSDGSLAVNRLKIFEIIENNIKKVADENSINKQLYWTKVGDELSDLKDAVLKKYNKLKKKNNLNQKFSIKEKQQIYHQARTNFRLCSYAREKIKFVNEKIDLLFPQMKQKKDLQLMEFQIFLECLNCLTYYIDALTFEISDQADQLKELEIKPENSIKILRSVLEKEITSLENDRKIKEESILKKVEQRELELLSLYTKRRQIVDSLNLIKERDKLTELEEKLGSANDKLCGGTSSEVKALCAALTETSDFLKKLPSFEDLKRAELRLSQIKYQVDENKYSFLSGYKNALKTHYERIIEIVRDPQSSINSSPQIGKVEMQDFKDIREMISKAQEIITKTNSIDSKIRDQLERSYAQYLDEMHKRKEIYFELSLFSQSYNQYFVQYHNQLIKLKEEEADFRSELLITSILHLKKQIELLKSDTPSYLLKNYLSRVLLLFIHKWYQEDMNLPMSEQTQIFKFNERTKFLGKFIDPNNLQSSFSKCSELMYNFEIEYEKSSILWLEESKVITNYSLLFDQLRFWLSKTGQYNELANYALYYDFLFLMFDQAQIYDNKLVF